MINERHVKEYCCDDLSLIENYELAINDTTQTWNCHHRGEVLPCGRFSIDDLKKFGLYFNRPAAELIFLTPSAHQQLHKKGVPKLYLKGVPLSEAHKKAISDAMKGVNAKKVMQLTKSGELIKEWQSMSEASKQLKINCSNICSCCNGIRKYASGYVWKYV